MFTTTTSDNRRDGPESDAKQPQTTATTEYCAKLQQWMWQYYWGYVYDGNWQSWMALSAFPFPLPCGIPPPGTGAQTPGTPASSSGGGQQAFDTLNRYSYPYPLSFQASHPHPGGAHTGQTSANVTDARPAQQQNGNPPQTGREYTIPSPLLRFLAETVDFFILFCVKATIVLWIMHLSGMKDIAKFITHFIVEEIDENTSMEDLQKMLAVALVYRVLVCVYETICIWGAGGATPGKFLLGLRVVTCDTSTLVRPNRVLVVPASNVSLSASTVRALNKNFSIAFLFPVFITLLFFQHNRTVYDIVAGTIVVQRRGGR
ncbi:protein FAM8A1 [Sander lucioperca]|uniref:Protein FAM8A1-like n=1 Tax=Sander lucioperca TaxID=283035 RepID=A0A8C9X1V8_SANLU|nr:protein FAM8A1 [Sander lucioperca]XP_031152112.1 protein FAM8A1 [Sander lucioperca]XP_031152113.1 protein FAM8A1 [Sander lucioperca]